MRSQPGLKMDRSQNDRRLALGMAALLLALRAAIMVYIIPVRNPTS
jgi:hypothetical protein